MSVSTAVSALPESSATQQEQHNVKERILLNVEAPPGPLRALVSRPTNDSQNHVFFASLQDNSPMEGKLQAGDWLLTINDIPVTSRQVCVDLFQKTSASTRILGISRAVAASPQNAANAIVDKIVNAAVSTSGNEADPTSVSSQPNPAATVAAVVGTNGNKENSPNAATTSASLSSTKELAAPTMHPLPPQDVLLAMSVAQLKQELQQRGIHVKNKPTKDDLLEKLGVPSRQWKAWRKLTIAQLKPLLQSRGLTVGGTKHELLTRLGVPVGFGESKHETFHREQREAAQKKRKLDAKLLSHALSSSSQNKKLAVSPENDPTHEEYELPCCSSPKFPPGHSSEPAGYIQFHDGSVMEVWRCVACGKIPKRPNAPPIHEFSDNESDNDMFHVGIAEHFYW